MKKKASPDVEPSLSPGLRRYVYFTAAVTGAAIMIIEILGAKMLSPFVGMSHFVWTAQIAVTLVALACGYYAGGRIADRVQRLSWLYGAILAAAAALVVSVLICEPVAYWALDFNLAVGSLLASTALFFAPLALLAMTGPFLVRMITSSVAGVGANVGRLTSISTLGSFAGTLLIGYVMIPLLPNSWTMYLTAAVLALISVGFFTLFRPRRAGGAAGGVALAALVGLLLFTAGSRQRNFVVERFSGNSNFGQLEVLDSPDNSARYYLNDNLTQNTYDPERKQSRSTFTYMLSGLARAYTTNISDVLCVGLGVGIVPMDFARQGAKVDVVEINPAVVPIAKQFFGLEPEKLNLTIDDGRHYLNRCRRSYDAVILDAFLGDSSPSHLLTREAFASVSRVLRPGGVLVINAFADPEPGKDFMAASLKKTLQAVFASVRLHSCEDGAIFYVASNHALTGFAREPDWSTFHPQVQRDAQEAFAHLVDTRPESGRILTDNYNPLEFYDAANREMVRRRLAFAARSL